MTDGTHLHKPPLLNCTITTSKVPNANPLQPFHIVPDKTGEVAPGAIALGGYVDNSSHQLVRCTSGSTWGCRVEHSTSLSQLFVGKYAVEVIAAYDIYGLSVEVIVPDGDAVP